MGYRLKATTAIGPLYVLSVARSIGDHWQKKCTKGLIHTPEVYRGSIPADCQYFVVACDGLFDGVSNEMVAQTCRDMKGQDPSEIAKVLTDIALGETHGN